MTEYYGYNESGQWVKTGDDGGPIWKEVEFHYPHNDENFTGLNKDWKTFNYLKFKRESFPSFILIPNFPNDYWGWLLNKPIYDNQTLKYGRN